MEAAHRSVGGSGPGRRTATQQLNQAYAVLLSAQFQGFCRDLHSECVRHLEHVTSPSSLGRVLGQEFLIHRRLDQGNPNAGNIGADFNRLGIRFWPAVESADSRNAQRQAMLVELNDWRNATAHQDFDAAKLGGSINLRLRRVRNWRAACHALALSFDSVMHGHLLALTAVAPW
jgi:hypothetical protein